jgi:hypothetical protein
MSNAVISRLDGAVREERQPGDRAGVDDDGDEAQDDDNDVLMRGATPAATSPSQLETADDDNADEFMIVAACSVNESRPPLPVAADVGLVGVDLDRRNA